jgi:gliding motility-associated-like protein
LLILSKNFHFSKLLLILSKIVYVVKRKILIVLIVLIAVFTTNAQQINIELYEQFNGRYDFTFVGNTLNMEPNGFTGPPTNPVFSVCDILTSSSADLNLTADDNIVAAYLYWAGSGTGDYEVKLNGQDIVAERTFPVSVTNTDGNTRPYFSAFADVTALVLATGNTTYTLSDLDLTSIINQSTTPQQNLYCSIGTNFGGWALVVIYKNGNLPLNQLNIYDGLQFVPSFINITLPSLNVIDNIGAKIGFVAWEGEENISVNETLTINGNILSNALNPADNAFNNTNSITGSDELWNMDLDIYDIQNFIQIGDETAEIELTSNQDFVMVNVVVTKLNSQLPDATITAQNVQGECNSRVITVDYTVSNINSTDPLPAGTPIAIYLNGDLIATAQTVNELPIDGSENGTVTLTIPDDVPLDFELLFAVDDMGDSTGGIVTETNEANNTFILNVSLPASPPLQQPADVTACDTGNGTGIFDFSAYETSLRNNPTDVVTFYTSQANAETETDPITNPDSYTSISNPQQIFVRLEDEDGCFTIGSFNLIAVDCMFPDATIVLGNIERTCNSRVITVQYTVNNFNSQDILPAATPISIYADGIFIEYTETLLPLPIGGSESGFITITIPNDIPFDFELTFVVDDTGDGTGIVVEMEENNNTDVTDFSLIVSPVLQQPQDIIACNQGLGVGTFDFSHYEEELKNNPADVVTFYTTLENAQQDVDPIFNTADFVSTSDPQQIFVRLFDGNCFTVGSFFLHTKKCPPTTYNYVTPNGDGKNDSFFVEGLRNIFTNFKMNIYNRWGNLVWTGDHSKEDWNGIATVNKVGPEGNEVPVGTYYFVLELNDPEYPEPIVGWVYVTE